MQARIIALGFMVALVSTLAQDVPPFTDRYCRTDVYPPLETDQVPKFVLDLDLKPENRWADLVKEKTQEIKNLIQDIKDMAGLIMNINLGTEIIDTLFAPLVLTFAEPYRSEIIGISDATEIPVAEIVLYNLFYEVSSLCTAIVAQDNNGQIYHLRNMDFGLFLGWDDKNADWVVSERLRPLLTNVEYQQGGKTVAKGIHFAGYVGLLTGVKPGVVSMNLNARDGQSSLKGIITSILQHQNGHWTGFAMRDAVVKATSFENALVRMSVIDVFMPAYLIIGGSKPGEGAVITRSQGNITANIKRLNASEGVWFLVQTNYDNWKSPPFYDDRRDPAIKCMKNITQTGAGMKGMYNVLSTKPMLNKLTTFTGMMRAADGTMDAYIRHCPDPCYPW